MRRGEDQSGGEVLSGHAVLVGNRQIAAFLRVPARAIPRLVRDEKMPVTKIGWFHMTTVAALVRWIERRAESDG